MHESAYADLIDSYWLQLGLVVLLTLLSGLGDAYGFVNTARAWQPEGLAWPYLGKAMFGFALSIVTYLFAARQLSALGVIAPELHLLIWLAVTLLGIALFGGRFWSWPLPEQLVGLLVIAGIAWLIWRVE